MSHLLARQPALRRHAFADTELGKNIDKILDAIEMRLGCRTMANFGKAGLLVDCAKPGGEYSFRDIEKLIPDVELSTGMKVESVEFYYDYWILEISSPSLD